MTWKTSSTDHKSGLIPMFLWQLRRSLPIGALYTGALVLLMCVRFHSICNAEYDINYIYFSFDSLALPILVVSLLLPPFQLGFFNNKRQGDLFWALPASRMDLFWGSFLSGLFWLIIAPLASLGGCLLIALFSGNPWGDAYLLMAIILGLSLLLSVLNYAFFLLASSTSGTILEYVVNALMLSGIVPALIFAFHQYCTSVIPGSWIDSHAIPITIPTLVSAVSPPFALFLTLERTFSVESPLENIALWQALWWVLLLAVLLALGAWSVQKWKSEHVGGSQGYPKLKLVLGGLAGSAATLAAGCLANTWEGVPQALAFMAFVFLGVWLVTEACRRKTLRGFYRHFGQPLLALILTLCLLIPVSLGLGLDYAVPHPDRVSGVSIMSPRWFFDTATPACEPGQEIAAIQEGYVAKYEIHAACQSQEMLGRVDTLQKKLVELERSIQYPYLPGRNTRYHYDAHSTSVDIRYWLNDDDLTAYKSYVLPPSTDFQELNQECRDLIAQFTSSPEYVKGFTPLCAIDALDKVSVITYRESDGKQDVAFYEDEGQKEEKNLSSLPNEKAVREKLEAALLDDFTHNRFADETTDFGNKAYALWYKSGARFTARGGMYNNLPAEGKEFTLLTWNNDAYTQIQIPPQMTSTIKVLVEIFQ